MERQVALLRGINVGKSARLGMADLRALLQDAGYEDVKTHLQSGNVVLTADATGADLERALELLLRDQLASPIRVVVRNATQLAEIVDADPLAEVADKPSLKQVSFLGDELDSAIAKELEAAAPDLAPERLVVRGREIYTWHPDGIQSSPTAKLLTDKRLQTTVTARNWNTVTKLLELVTA
ncbi:MAG TPA: DUF1697 domain-containing protein [Baekduia sp.]|uniref:DUF1697 domain-containing protein n=1 Tax=Baekduia sp. TaxID=2600305 RepID=UPI002D010106|nr:DUF1697 domain-containing protein [Baekduia sp.]HMJ33685.1 DUF1697 domain-containing protein [Baekduia sp.]